MIPNSWEIDAAVVNVLQADAALQALAPDGVFYELAPPNAKRFVVVTLKSAQDLETFDGRVAEDNVYAVQHVALAITDADAKAAAYRIDQLLHGQTLTVTGYAGASTHRDAPDPRIRRKAPAPDDASLVWFFSGGNYRVQAAHPDPLQAAAKPAVDITH